MVQFVVWGAGGRGKAAAVIFGADRIIAFIDSNPEKAGQLFFGRPVINFDSYKKQYSEYAILVSLASEEAVTVILKKEKIPYFSYNDCPPELMGYGWKTAKKYVNTFHIPEKKTAIYGDSLYSVLVYEHLINSGRKCIGMVCSGNAGIQGPEWLKRLFPFITVKKLEEVGEDIQILQSVSDGACGSALCGRRTRNIYDWRPFVPDYQNPRIASLKESGKGKRCFIVATGPSLTFADLEKLRQNHEFCISVNSIFSCFKETEWRPDQYVAVDVDVINHYNNQIREMDVRQKFIPDASIDFDYGSLTDEFCVYHSVFNRDAIEQGLISDDFSKYAYNSGTVTAVSLQLAMYEGFEKIYLLGCDCSYFETGLKHFNEPEEMQIKEYGVEDSAMEMLNYHINSYRRIKDYAARKGIEIYNATRGGYLEAFERVAFDDLFNR
jgi:hypothetical protein